MPEDFKTRIKTCDRCGMSNLHWVMFPDQRSTHNPKGFRLATESGAMHKCGNGEDPGQRPKWSDLRRGELVAAIHERFKPQGKWSPLNMRNEEMIAALETGVLPEHITKGGALPAIDVEGLMGILRGEMEGKIAELIAEMRPNIVEIHNPDTGERKDMGRQHERFPMLVRYTAFRKHIFLRGPAGGGKTEGAKHAAKAHNLDFVAYSISRQTSKADLMGYTDANGRYVPGILYSPFKYGKLLVLDEIDTAEASTLTIVNAALAVPTGGIVSFPSGKDEEGRTVWENVPRHKDFVCVANGNTYGQGSDAMYVGRAQLDAATLDRFLMMEWNYDEAFELELANQYGDATEWVKYVQTVRRCISKGQKVVVSPRASIVGAELLAGGIDRKDVEQSTIWDKMGPDDATQIKSRLRDALREGR